VWASFFTIQMRRIFFRGIWLQVCYACSLLAFSSSDLSNQKFILGF
jgi:hypothetical protein